jgi:DNA-binding HxlR family transcriptional regulator
MTDCSIAGTLEIIGDRWTILILRDAFRGVRRFDEIQQDLGIARNILTERLTKLVDHGVLEKRKYQDRPARYEYRLTDKGKDLQPAILTLLAWGDKHLAPEGPPTLLVHHDCDHAAEAVVVCSHCGGAITTRNVSAQAGPGATQEAA